MCDYDAWVSAGAMVILRCAAAVYVLYKIASMDSDSGTAEVFRSLKVGWLGVWGLPLGVGRRG